MTLQVQGTTVVNTNQSFVLGTATPGSPVTGMIRWSGSEFQVYNGTAWVPIITTISSPPLFGWGKNTYYGQLGSGNTITTVSPVSVVGGFTDWIQATAGQKFSVAIRANGTAWAWGDPSNGQLGNGTSSVSRSSPVSVVGGFTDWIQVSSGEFHTVGLRAGGQVWGWGRSNYGQWGQGYTLTRSSPTRTTGFWTDVSQIAAGSFHSLFLRNGTLWAAGRGSSGEVGNNAANNNNLNPQQVAGGFTDWVNVSGGQMHSVAIRANGTAWCWGSNFRGQLGTNSVTSTSSPVSVAGGFTDWTQISAGGQHTVGLRANGTIWAWGYSNYGQLGNNLGSGNNRSSPASVVGGFTDWVTLGSVKYQSLAIRGNGTAWAWGRNSLGQLGNGDGADRSSPSSVLGGINSWVSLAGGRYHSLGIRAI